MSDTTKPTHHKEKPKVVLTTGQGADEPPEHLDSIGKMCYKKVVQDLRDMGIVDRADSRAIEAFSSAYEEYRKARKVCLDKGFSIEIFADQDGELVCIRTQKRVETDVMQSAWMRMRSLLPELYLTPASRMKAPGSGEKPAANTWDELIPGS